jgi:hypothetical protein
MMIGKFIQSKRISLIGVFLFSIQIGFSQLSQRSEFGFGIGAFNYSGDLVRTYNILNSKPAGTAFYRVNISKVVSFRTALTAGRLGASDKRPLDRFAKQRASAFNIFVLEASTVFEYHFLDWREDKRKLRFTPYLFGGFSLFTMAGIPAKNAEYSNVQPAIPFGGGMKYVLNPKWYVSFEFGVRKTFFDYLDNISDGDLSLKNYQYGNRHDNDTFFFTGFAITCTLYDIPCPTNPYR